VNVPTDFPELIQRYRRTLEAAGADYAMAQRIVDRGMLEKAPRTKGMARYLRRCVEQLQQEDAASCFEWPEGLPRDNNELYTRYRGLVVACLRKAMRWGPDQGELDPEQEIWAELLHTDILAKYRRVGLLKRMPSTMALPEVLDYLGIPWELWDEAGPGGRPVPVSGSWTGSDGVFKTLDIQELDTDENFPERPLPRRLPASTTDVRKFEVYLRTSIQNRIKNMFRTTERRFIRDAPMRDPNVFLAGSTKSGSYQVAYSDKDGKEAWEHSVVSEHPSADVLCDIHALAGNMGALAEDGSYLDSSTECSPQVIDDIAALVKQAQHSGFDVDSDDAATFVRMLSEGWNRPEALLFVQRLKRRALVQAAS
jgi:hypothetical protein